MIVDLNEAVLADYALMDAVVGMEGPGPGAGRPRELGQVLASSNLLALDAAACCLIGYPPAEIPVSREALARGRWLQNFEQIEYPLTDPRSVTAADFEKIPFKKNSGNQLLELILPRAYRKFREAFTPRPVIDPGPCLRCGDCARICASQAISLADKQMVIDYRRCIRCYCCHEICPVKAIDVKRFKLL
jgi:ferredoxin